MKNTQWWMLAAGTVLALGCRRPAGVEPRPARVVVLGSSTAAGVGASGSRFAWVNRYGEYLKAQMPGRVEIINLAVSGHTTYHVLPASTTRAAGRPASDTAHNVTKALAYKPTVIIVSLPSNDIAGGYLVAEVMGNFKALAAAAGNVPLWIATPQPKNFEVAKRRQLLEIKRLLETTYPGRTLDFWTVLANPDGTIMPAYNVDGTHLNDAGHEQLFQQAVKAEIVKTK